MQSSRRVLASYSRRCQVLASHQVLASVKSSRLSSPRVAPRQIRVNCDFVPQVAPSLTCGKRLQNIVEVGGVEPALSGVVSGFRSRGFRPTW